MVFMSREPQLLFQFADSGDSSGVGMTEHIRSSFHEERIRCSLGFLPFRKRIHIEANGAAKLNVTLRERREADFSLRLCAFAETKPGKANVPQRRKARKVVV